MLGLAGNGVWVSRRGVEESLLLNVCCRFWNAGSRRYSTPPNEMGS